jgi:hypothetical protein
MNDREFNRALERHQDRQFEEHMSVEVDWRHGKCSECQNQGSLLCDWCEDGDEWETKGDDDETP